MTFRNIAAAAAALTLAASPAMAQAERTSAPTEETAEMGGSSLILAILAIAAVVIGVIIAADNGDGDVVSP
jgi:hypothetical protein